MNRALARALALATFLIASSASAQTVIVIEQPPPPPVIVVIEPPPPPEVVVVVPAPEPVPAPSGPRPRWVVDLSGDLLIGAGYDWPALGGSLRAGLTFDPGVTAQLAARYASSMDVGSEVTLGLEVQRDFSPADVMGFLLLAHVGTAFLLDDRGPNDSGIRLDGQVGVGGRFDLGSDVAMLVDFRGVLRFHPDDPWGPSERDLAAGVLMSVGIRVRL